jgi:hypothetical protein
MIQNAAYGAMLGDNWSLIPPRSEEFSVCGTVEIVERARDWAERWELLLYRGPAECCVHGLYRMDVCSFPACTTVGMDHSQIWVRRDAKGAFILTQPYVTEVPERLRAYAEMHGLSVDSRKSDGWYGHGSLPIRLTIPQSWPLWPIERDAVLLLHTQPIEWPGGDA